VGDMQIELNGIVVRRNICHVQMFKQFGRYFAYTVRFATAVPVSNVPKDKQAFVESVLWTNSHRRLFKARLEFCEIPGNLINVNIEIFHIESDTKEVYVFV